MFDSLSKRAQLKQCTGAADCLLTAAGNVSVVRSELQISCLSYFVFLPHRSVTRSYYRNSVGGLLVFDMTSRDSFDHIKEWHDEVCERVQPHKVLFVLVSQKRDRDAYSERTVSREEAEKLAGQLGMPYIEVSAKTGQNVEEAFELLARRVYQGLLSGEVELQQGWDGVKVASSHAFQLQRASRAQSSKAPTKKKKCCG